MTHDPLQTVVVWAWLIALAVVALTWMVMLL